MPGNIKVLLVDDNPMVLEMLRQALAQFSSVSTLTDGADAMLRAIDDKPDLIISDYSMQALDGKQLVQKLKGRSTTANIPVILKEAAARIKKVVDKISLEKMAREAPGESVLRGSLAQMNVMDLLQSLDMGHKTCALTLSNGTEKCRMFFTDGQINDAEYGSLKGDEAVYKVLTWTGGNFEINFAGSSTAQTVTRSTQGLLLEGLRLLDESNRDTEE